ncbi:hypothetical protein HZC31_08850 [Candidatus Woesearchaeota archaeon]|nr:hypothetical protein [Candidatus Woesearchaeota archaeon]
MVGEVRINYQPQSREERLLLEEIIQRTRASAQIEKITVDIYVETFERAETEENVLTFGEAEVDYETKTGRVTIPATSKKTLSPLAFKGLLYSMIGAVFGAYFFKTEEEEQELFSEEKTPQREALFDYIMLYKGGTVEALIAYKVESVRRTMGIVARHKEEMGFNTGAFATYCNQLDQLQENLGTTIYCLATKGIITRQQKESYDA